MALVFVLGVSGIKAVAEDKKRHTEDRKTNVSLTHILADGGKPSPLALPLTLPEPSRSAAAADSDVPTLTVPPLLLSAAQQACRMCSGRT